MSLEPDQLAAISELVRTGTLSQQQADAVRSVLTGAATSALTGAQTNPDIAAVAPAWRYRLSEIAGYVGGTLVGVAALVLISQSWDRMSRPGKLALLITTALVATGVAVAVVRTTPGRRQGIGDPVRAPRRRLASLLLVGGSASLTGAVVVALGPHAQPRLVASVVGLISIVVVDRYVSSALSEIGAFAWTTSFVFTLGDKIRPTWTAPVTNISTPGPPPRTTYDLIFPLVVIAVGLLWATVVSRVVQQRLVAIVLGLGLTFIEALVYLNGDRTRAEGLVVIAVLAAVGLWRYLAQSLWPWLLFAIVTLTAFMFELVGGSSQPVLGFLAAGLALLALSGFGVWRRHRRAA